MFRRHVAHLTICAAVRQFRVPSRLPPAPARPPRQPKGQPVDGSLDAGRSQRKPLQKESRKLDARAVQSRLSIQMAAGGVDSKAGNFLRMATLAESSGARAKYAT